MDDHLTADNSEGPVCSHCQQRYRDRCSCRDEQGEAADSPDSRPEASGDAGLSIRDSVSPEARSIPDLQTRATPPAPDVRTAPPTAVDQQSVDDSPPSAEEAVDESDTDSQTSPTDKDPAASVDSPVGVAATAGSPSPPKTPRPAPKASQSNRRPKWGWILVVGPLLVALAIIAWFHFRVLPPVVENDPPPAVDFPAGGVASRPGPDPVSEELGQETPPPALEPTNPDPSEIENNPDDPGQGDEDQSDSDAEGGDQTDEPDPENPALPEPVLVEVDPSDFQQFDSQTFINLFDDIGYLPNLVAPSQMSITGDDQADQNLRTIADSAGYVSQPVVADPSQLIGVHQLQPVLAEQWLQLERAATAAGYSLVITTGHLSVSDQVNIFGLQLGNDLSDQTLAAAATQVMVPGYSRHQTGFAIDVVDGNNPGAAFVETEAYSWLSADNFAIAKHFGFIPSYAGVGRHGQAEHQIAFELVYVGRDRLSR